MKGKEGLSVFQVEVAPEMCWPMPVLYLRSVSSISVAISVIVNRVILKLLLFWVGHLTLCGMSFPLVILMLAAVVVTARTSPSQPRPVIPLDAPLQSLLGESCNSNSPLWTLSSTGQLKSTNGLCATTSFPIVDDKIYVQLETCSNISRDPRQTFLYFRSNGTIVAAAAPTQCMRLAARLPLAVVIMSPCTRCASNSCTWEVTNPNFTRAAVQHSTFCLGAGAPAPLPQTCETGSASYALPFCDPSLTLELRIRDLVARLDVAQKVQQWSVPVSRFVYDPILNLKGYLWDLTCMRGIAPGEMSPVRTTTVYPHAIGLAATWDVSLIARVGAATWLEGRIVNEVNYNASGGTSWQGVHCDGGPLANTAHDPRWGRISETYGEDPFLSATMGVTATVALQNRSADRRWLASSQVTRHFLGYHGANDLLHQGEEFIDFHGFADQQDGPYRSMQEEGGAEGIMMALSAFSIGARSAWNSSVAPMIPSTVHPYLWAKLRDEWRSDAFAQTDCCDSLTAMVADHHYFPDLESAITAALEMGLDASYGPNPAIDTTLTTMLGDGRIDEALLDTRISRTLLTRFRLGEFDAKRNPQFPYNGPFNVSALDGPAHRTLARDAAAASIVLLRNVGGLLPLHLADSNRTLAVVGPFANCSSPVGGYGIPEADAPVSCSYLHSYAGYASSVSTIIDAVAAEGAASGFHVTYSQGSNLLTPLAGGIDGAVATARAADIVLVVVGLSSLVEAEGVDRENVTLPGAQQDLVDALSAAVGPSRLILVVVSGGGVDTSYAAAGASIAYFYPGEEAGTGLVDVLFGRVAPSGRLPLTVFKSRYLDLIDPVSVFTLVTAQGTGRTYRYLNESASGGAPGSLVHFWFGFGLSYTAFEYSGLTASVVSPRPGPGAPPSSPLVLVTASVANVGSLVTASEVAQCYVSVPRDAAARNATGDAPLPRYSLQWFHKVPDLVPGAAPTQLTFSLPIAAFETTTRGGGKLITGGEYTVWVSGHLPDDGAGAEASNVVSVVITL